MQLTECQLGFIGGGNMAQALISGLCKQADFKPSNIQVVELDGDKRTALEQSYQVRTTSNLKDIAACDVIILAVKPQQLKALSEQLSAFISSQLIISIAAGTRLKDLSQWLNAHQKLIRVMPNTPAQILEGVSGLYAMPAVTSDEEQIATAILSAVGETVWVTSEDDIDSITAISGSGPAYVFYLIEALEEAALALGLTPEQAQTLSVNTFKGASLLADQSNVPIKTLREQVTSKGGTTEQGLLSLADSEVKAAIIKAAEQAKNRAITLGDELGDKT